MSLVPSPQEGYLLIRCQVGDCDLGTRLEATFGQCDQKRISLLQIAGISNIDKLRCKSLRDNTSVVKKQSEKSQICSANWGSYQKFKGRVWGTCYLYFRKQNLGNDKCQRAILSWSPTDLFMWKLTPGAQSERKKTLTTTTRVTWIRVYNTNI